MSRQSDRQIRAAVLDQLSLDRRSDQRRIIVEVSDGVVTLSGELNTPGDLARAVELASAVDGIVDVVSDLRFIAPPLSHWGRN